MPAHSKIAVYIENGVKKSFACAVDWPGWSRIGENPETAIQTLRAYGPRYAKAIRPAKADFIAPAETVVFAIVERLRGGATTDFGVPHQIPKLDWEAMNAADVRRAGAILQAFWRAFDRAVQAAGEKPLTKGPRGGGRELLEIVRHVTDAEGAYLGQIGWKLDLPAGASLEEIKKRTRNAVLDGLAAAARGELPARGPRGGLRWPARYFVRRTAWHILDHAWEIEDRTA